MQFRWLGGGQVGTRDGARRNAGSGRAPSGCRRSGGTLGPDGERVYAHAHAAETGEKGEESRQRTVGGSGGSLES